MADFLTRLASRTLGLASLAEPVIAPMFAAEPSPPAMIDADAPLAVSSAENSARAAARRTPPDSMETTSRAMITAPDDAIDSDLPARRRTPSSPTSETADENALLMPTAPAAEAPKPPPPIETTMSARASPRVTRPAMMTPAETTPLTITAAETPAPSSTPSIRSVRASGGRGAPARTEPPSAPVVRSDVEPRRAAPASWDAADEPLLLPLDPAAASPMRRDAPDSGPIGRAAAIPVDASEPRRGERSQPAAAAAPPADPPTIEITIGRIEVRAVQPPAPVAQLKPAAPIAPRLSLEEYLRNQHGGRR